MRNLPAMPLALFVVILYIWPLANRPLYTQQAPAKPAAPCVKVADPEFGGALICHETALELKNTVLEMDNAHLSYQKITGDYRAHLNELQQTKNAQIAKILKDNPEFHIEADGTFAKNVPAAAPTKPEVKPAPAARK